MSTLYDKHANPLSPEDTVKYGVQKKNSDAVTEGFARFSRFSETGKVMIRLWDGVRQCFSPIEMAWDVKTYGDGVQAYVELESSGETVWLEKMADEKTFNQPIELWPKVLSYMAVQFMHEEDVSFALRGKPMTNEEVADSNGFLSMLMMMAEEKKLATFPESKPSIYFYAQPNSLLDLSFGYDENGDSKHNTLYHCVHFLYDVLQEFAHDLKKSPEKAIDGRYPLDDALTLFYDKTQKRVYRVWPHRPTEKNGLSPKATSGKGR
jgi:hypothetical protein